MNNHINQHKKIQVEWKLSTVNLCHKEISTKDVAGVLDLDTPLYCSIKI